MVTIQGTFLEANFAAIDFAEKLFHVAKSIKSRNIWASGKISSEKI